MTLALVSLEMFNVELFVILIGSIMVGCSIFTFQNNAGKYLLNEIVLGVGR